MGFRVKGLGLDVPVVRTGNSYETGSRDTKGLGKRSVPPLPPTQKVKGALSSCRRIKSEYSACNEVGSCAAYRPRVANFRVFKGLGFRVLGFRVWGLGFKVKGLGFRV